MSIDWENVMVKSAPTHTPYKTSDPFPWGKHQGKPIRDVPRDYLTWALNTADRVKDDPGLRAAIVVVLGLSPADTPEFAGPDEVPAFDDSAELLRLRADNFAAVREVERLRKVNLCLGGENARLRADNVALQDRARRGSPGDQDRKIRRLEAELESLRARTTTVDMKLTDKDRFTVVVKGWFRAMSLLHHPDRGGAKEKQAVVTACYKDLMKRLEDAR